MYIFTFNNNIDYSYKSSPSHPLDKHYYNVYILMMIIMMNIYQLFISTHTNNIIIC